MIYGIYDIKGKATFLFINSCYNKIESKIKNYSQIFNFTQNVKLNVEIKIG